MDDPSGETIFGEPVAFEVGSPRRTLPEITPIPIERADVGARGDLFTMRRLAGPLSTGAMVAGFVVVAMLLIVHSTTPPRKSVASPVTTMPATMRGR